MSAAQLADLCDAEAVKFSDPLLSHVDHATADLLRQAAAELRALGGGGFEVRTNSDGTLDEIVGSGTFHLEQMGAGHWWMQVGPHMVNLTSRGKIAAHFGENEASSPAATVEGL